MCQMQIIGLVVFFYAMKMRLHSVSYESPRRHLPPDVNLNVTSVYPKLLDSDSTTCEDIPMRELIGILWYHPINRTTNQYRVYMKEHSSTMTFNSVWFLSGIELGPMVTECDVTQQHDGDMVICDISCL